MKQPQIMQRRFTSSVQYTHTLRLHFRSMNIQQATAAAAVAATAAIAIAANPISVTSALACNAAEGKNTEAATEAVVTSAAALS